MKSVVANAQESLAGMATRHLNPARERVLLVLLMAAVIYPCYFVLGVLIDADTGRHPILWIDHVTPLVPAWMYVYVHVFMVAFLPAAVVRCAVLFRKAVAAYTLTQVLAFAFFAALPVTMTLRVVPVHTDSFATWGLVLTYWLDQPVNCFPSLHVALSCLSGLICWKVDRLVGGLTLLLAAAIAVSTMLVKQHYFVDVVGGCALAALAYAIFVAKAAPTATRGESPHLSRWYVVGVAAAYWCVIGAFYLAYLAQWTPWKS